MIGKWSLPIYKFGSGSEDDNFVPLNILTVSMFHFPTDESSIIRYILICHITECVQLCKSQNFPLVLDKPLGAPAPTFMCYRVLCV